jgi:hypothetical protein
MISRFVICITAALFSISCSNNFYVKREKIRSDYLNQINYLGKHKIGKIKLIDSKRIEAEKINVVSDSLNYIYAEISRSEILPLTKIEEISFNDHFVGFIYGLVAGFGIGTLVGYSLIDRSTEMAELGILGYAGGGLLIGSISGTHIGVERKYIFIEDQ